MPLKSGKSNKAVNQNIATLRREGRPRAQAIAIALRKGGRAKKRPTVMSGTY